jgi:hypothetical protein
MEITLFKYVAAINLVVALMSVIIQVVLDQALRKAEVDSSRLKKAKECVDEIWLASWVLLAITMPFGAWSNSIYWGY